MARYEDNTNIWGGDIGSKIYQALIWVNINPTKLARTPVFDSMVEKLVDEVWDLTDFLNASKRLAVKDSRLRWMP